MTVEELIVEGRRLQRRSVPRTTAGREVSMMAWEDTPGVEVERLATGA